MTVMESMQKQIDDLRLERDAAREQCFKLQRERDAARENHLKAQRERDEALTRLSRLGIRDPLAVAR
jgi:uncharacterized protein (DUF3084 family)